MSDAFDLSGEVAVITGGAGILGPRFADALAGCGAKVAVLDRSPGKTQHRSWQVDVTDRAGLERARAEVEKSLGAATVLVNAAATKSDGFFEPFETYRLEDWETVMRTNVTGAMLASQVFGAPMAAAGRGSIINILSIYGIVAPDQRIYEGSPFNTPGVYSASKAALWGLTRYLATYWAENGVRVNAVTPGGVSSGQNPTFVKQYSARVPLGRMAEADEISGAVVFLASRASSYITGQNIVVDGGLSAW
jgi:NAD(P)-dependent dehydrogenase (short-subunit alcohol dehydrogenase family)